MPLRTRVFWLVSFSLLVILALLACTGNTPTVSPLDFNYQVRVQTQDTGDYIVNATVTLEVKGQAAPLDGITDSKGVARIFISDTYLGQPGFLIVEAPGYKKFTRNIDLTEGSLPDVVQLELAQKDTPTDTPLPPTDTPTATTMPVPIDTPTNSTAQKDTPTDTPLRPTDTPTATTMPVLPTDTPISTSTPTNTSVPPTDTPMPTSTSTYTPIPPIPTPASTPTDPPYPACLLLGDWEAQLENNKSVLHIQWNEVDRIFEGRPTKLGEGAKNSGFTVGELTYTAKILNETDPSILEEKFKWRGQGSETWESGTVHINNWSLTADVDKGIFYNGITYNRLNLRAPNCQP